MSSSRKQRDADLPTVVELFKSMPETELEAVVRGITPGEFKTILKFFEDNPDYSLLSNKLRLDIAIQNGRQKVRITLSDGDTIGRFVGYGEAPTSRFANVIQKTLVKQLDFPDEGFRVNLKEEKPIPNSDPGRLIRIVVTTAMSAAATTIYDNASAASGTILFVIPASATQGTVYTVDLPAVNGIYASFAGTGTVTFGYS